MLSTSLNNAIELIKDKTIRDFVTLIFKDVDKKFYTGPSSSSGKYHPNENNNEGGLVRHTIKTMIISIYIAELYGLKSIQKDILIASALLHDAKKFIGNRKKTNTGHAFACYEFIKSYKSSFDDYNKNIDSIAKCVRFHMGKFTVVKSEKKLALTENCILVKIIQIADYISSRKSVSFLPGVDLEESRYINYEFDRSKYVL